MILCDGGFNAMPSETYISNIYFSHSNQSNMLYMDFHAAPRRPYTFNYSGPSPFWIPTRVSDGYYYDARVD